jgi:hypothetical protein
MSQLHALTVSAKVHLLEVKRAQKHAHLVQLADYLKQLLCPMPDYEEGCISVIEKRDVQNATVSCYELIE